jgi:guanosine-3',5'-bis(diphosphate) 3'-pyrophosphohydrolase
MSLKEYLKLNPQSPIAAAGRLSEEAHKGQKRLTGEPYFTHPLAVAEILWNWKLDETTIVAGLLHDTVEDTTLTLEDIKQKFGESAAFLVNGMTKLSRIKYRGSEEDQAENLRKMILALSQDLRVVFIKLADRLHNMRTLP